MDTASTNRVQFVRDLEQNNSLFLLRGSFSSAFISCLTPEETCQVLDLDFHQEPRTRHRILRKIERDIEDQGFKECHYQLVDKLLGVIGTLPYNKKQGGGHCLSYLYDFAPPDIQHRLLRFFLDSKYVILRRRAYKKLRADWDASYQERIEEAWNVHHDSDCARLIIDRFPVEYLIEHFFELLESVEESWHSTKLYLRMSMVDHSKLEHLSATDEMGFPR